MKTPKAKLTPIRVEKLTVPGDHFDATLPSFALRVSPNGAKSYVCFYRIAGKLVRATLGRHPQVSLAAARRIARETFEAVAAGKDPRADRIAERLVEAKLDADSYEQAVEDFVAGYARAKKQNRRWKEQRLLLLRVGRKWLKRPVSSITSTDINGALDAILGEGHGYMANRCFEVLSTLFKWLHMRDRAGQPMLKVTRPFDGEGPRKRAWSDAEVKAIWKAGDELRDDLGMFMRLVVLLGARSGEVSGMCWSELDLDAATWQLPAARAKNKHDRLIPLPKLAVRMLKTMPRIEGTDHVFAGRGGSMVVGTRYLEMMREATGIKDFRLHDSRRTFRSYLDKAGVQPHIKLEALGHARQGVGDVHYSVYDYLDEKRAAFELWADHVSTLAYGKSVIPLRG